MAEIRKIESQSVHRIQSGQVITSISSVLKELLENALDAEATSISIVLTNSGLDGIEVHDNGNGIREADFPSIARKHYTSKLSSFSDLDELTTFGFRGEALSSLTALAQLTITTAREENVPMGHRIEFDQAGEVSTVSVVAAQRGTKVCVDKIFHNLPVRRKELERNIKREYVKALAMLQAYACVCVNLRIAVSNVNTTSGAKKAGGGGGGSGSAGKKTVVFATNGNATTRENIANVYGSKTVQSLTPLDLELPLPISRPVYSADHPAGHPSSTPARLVGHISRPVFGSGRATTDRQLFFVNSRPCNLPQIAKAINDTYKAYNTAQSPFVFADLRLDTSSYDVNVSPDKRTVLLHEIDAVVDAVRKALNGLFEGAEVSVPLSLRPIGGAAAGGGDAAAAAAPQEDDDQDDDYMDDDRVPDLGPDVNVASSPIKCGEDEVPSSPGRPTSPTRLSGAEVDDLPDRGEPQSGTKKRNINSSRVSLPTPNPHSGFVSAKSLFVRSDDEDGNDGGDLDDEAEMDVDSDGDGRTGGNSRPRASPSSRSVRSGAATGTRTQSAPSVRSVLNSLDSGRLSSSPLSRTGTSPGAQSDLARNSLFKSAFQKMWSIPTGDQTPAAGSSSSSTGNTHTLRAGRDEDGDGDEDDAVGGNDADSNDVVRDGGTESPEKATVVIGDRVIVTEMSSQRKGRGNDYVAGESPQSERDGRRKRVRIASPEAEDDRMVMDGEDDGPVTPRTGNTRPRADDDGDSEMDNDLAPSNDQDGDEPTQRPRTDSPSHRRPTGIVAAPSDSTHGISFQLTTSEPEIERLISHSFFSPPDSATARSRRCGLDGGHDPVFIPDFGPDQSASAAEASLSLTVSKDDFGRMKVIGQFNLGFIIAVLPALKPGGDAAVPPAGAAGPSSQTGGPGGVSASPLDDHLFIIDQHASDEKATFEHLCSTFRLSAQRLVRPLRLKLTAVEKEIVRLRADVISANGFQVECVNGPSGSASSSSSSSSPSFSSAHAAGDGVNRVSDDGADSTEEWDLVSLPVSKDFAFSVDDLYELIGMLVSDPASTRAVSRPSRPGGDGDCETGDDPEGKDSGGDQIQSPPPQQQLPQSIPRPSKVHRLLASRACRSSVMIGRALTIGQMTRLVRRMGNLQKPWNCPHGRPTMRHLGALNSSRVPTMFEDKGKDTDLDQSWKMWAKHSRELVQPGASA